MLWYNVDNMNDEVIQILKKVGAVITDSHIVLTSGRHSSAYINKDALYPHTALTSRIGELFAQKNKDLAIDVVIGPALGGIILSQWTAYHLSQIKNKEIFGVYTEKDAESNQVFSRRGYDKYMPGKNVLVVEDLTTTGGSVKKVVDTVKKAGGNIAQVCVMVNRDPKNVTSETVGAPFSSLSVLEITSYGEEECPLCKNHVPINTVVGHGKKYLTEKGMQTKIS